MRQKFMKIFCSLIMITSVFVNVYTPNVKVAANTEGENVGYAEPPFKAQLDNDAAIFYNALQSLFNDGKMKTGVGSYDLSASFDQNTLNKYASGDSTLAKAFQSARDAFVMDTPEIFYVDFSKVTLRLGMKNGTYVLYVNNGSNENYFTSSFSTEAEVDAAIAQVNEKKNLIKASLSDTTLANPASIITALHNKLIENTEYTYPSKDSRNVSNVYGTLVDGKANCDGYSRTLKWILDDYNITNVLVAGVGKNARYEESDKVQDIMNEYHQWNYVKLDGKWYAVDVTWDDPIKEVKVTNADIRTTYLLRGSDMLNENHFPMGAFSEGGQEFKYPKLEKLDYGVDSEEAPELGDDSTDLKVAVSLAEYTNNEGEKSKATRFTVNYKNMGYEKLEEQGLYAAVRYGMKLSEGTEFKYNEWAKFDPDSDSVSENPNDLYDIILGLERRLQFCITSIDQPVIDNTDINQNYGDIDLSLPDNHVVLSKEVVTPFFENYTPAPFIRTSMPALTGRILPEKTHYAVEYYEELEIIDASKPVSIKINNTAAHIDAKVENITYKNSTYKSPVGTDVVSTIVEFDFTPDSSFQGYENVYRLQIENMQGVNSKKIANDIPIITTYTPEMPCPIYAAAGGPNSAFVMSNPVLVANEDMANDMFQDKGGNTLKYGNLNIALVASKTTGTKKEDLDNVLGDKMSNAKASSTFELSLGCGPLAAALRPGYHVSVGIPYPEGFHPEDYKDVEFRAYHFKMVDGKWVSEEIICQITPQGLMIIADSFSPFTIVAYEKDQAPVSKLQAKSVNVKAEDNGGTITTPTITNKEAGAAGTYAVEKEGSRTFTVTPNEGYIIEKVMLNNSEVNLTDKTSYTATFDYDTMKDSNDMKVFFVAKSVIEEEKRNNIEPVTPVIAPNESITPPTYVNKIFNVKTGEGVDIKISAKVLQDPSLELTLAPLSKEALTSFEKYNDKATMIASGTPGFKTSRAAANQEDSVTYKIPVETTSSKLVFLTYDANSNSYTEFEAQVINGIAEVTVPNFNAFALLDKTSTTANKTYLQSDYDELIKLNENDYTAKSWNTFKDKLDDAKLVLDNENATQEQVNKAKSALSDAKTNLVKRANKEMLKMLIENAQTAKVSGKYTSASLKALDAAMTAAKTVNDNVNATEVAVTKVYKELEVAIQGLVELGDKTTLTQLVKEANALDLSKYTDASVKVLKDAIINAQKVLDDEDATLKQIEVSINAIKNAMATLENKATGDNGLNNGNNTTSDGPNTGDRSNITIWMSLLVGSACLLLLKSRRLFKNR